MITNQKYKIIDSYSLPDSKSLQCDNCNKLIHNVAVIEGENGEIFHIGMDCAKTITTLSKGNIDEFNNGFKIAKSIKAKVNKALKQYTNYEVIVTNKPNIRNNKIYIRVVKKNELFNLHTQVSESITLNDLKRYLPDYYKICKINFDFIPIDEHQTIISENNTSFDEFYFDVSFVENKYGGKDTHISLLKDGKVLLSKTNKGAYGFYTANKEAILLYNTYMFNSGLHDPE